MFGTFVRRCVMTVGGVCLAAALAAADTGPAFGRLPGLEPGLVTSSGGAADTIVDAGSGLTISVEVKQAGTVSVKATGHGLDVRKDVTNDGAFSFTIAGSGDTISVAGVAGAVTVTRGSESVRIPVGRVDANTYARAAGLVSGSPALRLFRGAVSRLSPATRETVGGTALEIGDVLLRIIQDDPGAVERLRDGRQGVGAVLRVAMVPRPCYGDWEQEVLDAWGDYEGCYNDFSWWSGGREACAFVYMIRVEAAWFQFLTCVGFRAT